MPLGLEQATTLPVELNLKEISSFVVSYTGQQDAELTLPSILKAFEASADSITKELYVFDSNISKWTGLKSMTSLTVMDTAEEFLQLTHSFIEQLQLRKTMPDKLWLTAPHLENSMKRIIFCPSIRSLSW